MTKTAVSDVYENLGIEPGIALLKNFVPMMDLSDAHLQSIMRLARMVTAPVGQSIADQASLQTYYIYLVSGEICAGHEHSNKQTLHSAADASMLSLGDYLPDANLITSRSDCQILVIEREKLDSMLCWDQVAKSLLLELAAEREFDEDREWVQTLLMSNLFHKIPPYNIRHVLDRFEPRVVQSGEVIIREGERGDECYLIKEGRAVVTQANEIGSCQRQLAVLSAGQCFGEDALVNMTVRNASVTMETNGVLMVLKKREFLALMAEPQIDAVTEVVAKTGIDNGAQWLDVRSQQEFDYEHKKDAFHLPLHLMAIKSRLMNPGVQYFAYCSTGRRAATASYLLQQRGFDVTAVMP